MAYSYKTGISFALVYIPVKLHKAAVQNTIGFNMLDKKTKSRIKYIKTCEECNGKEVLTKDIIKGYKTADDEYIVFEKQELERLKTPKDKTVTIDGFVNISEIDQVYYDESYYVEPQGADKAYFLLAEALESEGKAGIAKCVLGSRESVVLLRAKDGFLVLSTLFFDEEIKPVPFKADNKQSSQKELVMAMSIIKSMEQKFEPSRYKDEYTERLRSAIEQKKAGLKVQKVPQGKAQPKITDLFSALENSLKMFDKKIVTKTGKPKTVKKSAAVKKAN